MKRFTEVYTARLRVRWGDMDSLGHVNNTIFFRYAEQTRVEWLEAMGLQVVPHAGEGIVVASADMAFRQPVLYPAELECRMLAASPGRSSLVTRTEIRRIDADATRTLVAEGHATLVWVDYQTTRPTPWPDAIRLRLPSAQADTD